MSDINLPQSGSRTVWVKRAIIAGNPARIQVWLTTSDAYAEIQFDDDDPELNVALLSALEMHRAEIESSYGAALDWRGHDGTGQRTKRTKVVAPKVALDPLNPSEEGLQELAQSARRLIDAVKPFLVEVAKTASIPADG